MDKRHLHHIWTKIRAVKPWYFLILVVIGAVICIFALRANNEHMVRLRDAVYTADQNNTDVQAALQNLQAYVTTHMNTDLSTGNGSVYPPIQLKYTYQRLQEAQANQLSQTNTQLYTEAQAYCQKLDPTDFSGHNRVPCIEQYVQSHGSLTLPQIPTALYEFSFASPTWSPDLAGWSLFVTVLLAVFFVADLAIYLWFRNHAR